MRFRVSISNGRQGVMVTENHNITDMRKVILSFIKEDVLWL